MEVREATLVDAKAIEDIYMQAFDEAEAKTVAELAVKLLKEKPTVKIISLVALQDNNIVAHIAFSPVLLESSEKHIGYILAPLAVLPKYQKNKIGSSLVKYGLNLITKPGSDLVFVYGDPQYYSRFGFETTLAKNYLPKFELQYPEGWHALVMNSELVPKSDNIICVDSLNAPELW